jgi:hypothetical protein
MFLASPQIANACGCYPRATVLEDFAGSDVVVIARVVSVEPATKPQPFYLGDVESAHLVVEKVYKGSVKVNDTLLFAQGDEIIGCSRSFGKELIGMQWLLYLDTPEKPSDPWYISTCNRSRGLEYVDDDLSYLNNMRKLRGRTRISGVLEADFENYSVAGRKLRIVGRNKTYIATTDKDGLYELYDVPPGRYVLVPELETGWRVDNFHLTRQLKPLEIDLPPTNRVAFTLLPHKHFGIDISFTKSNNVSGVVRDSSGRGLKSVCVSFKPPDNESVGACSDLSDELGRFQIDSVEAGAYLMFFTYRPKETAGKSFPKFYYPGVSKRGEAKIFTLKHGEIINNLKVVVAK